MQLAEGWRSRASDCPAGNYCTSSSWLIYISCIIGTEHSAASHLREVKLQRINYQGVWHPLHTFENFSRVLLNSLYGPSYPILLLLKLSLRHLPRAV